MQGIRIFPEKTGQGLSNISLTKKNRPQLKSIFKKTF